MSHSENGAGGRHRTERPNAISVTDIRSRLLHEHSATAPLMRVHRPGGEEPMA